MVTFRCWLFAQNERNDRIGDLARDARYQPGNWRSQDGLHREMLDQHASEAALETFDDAVTEWRYTEDRSDKGDDDRMATFSQWLKTQGDRDDAVGHFSRYWDSVTPGKISSVSGMQRHLEKIAKSYEEAESGTGQESRENVQVKTALSSLPLAVKDYHRAEARENAIKTGAMGPDAQVTGGEGGAGEPAGPDGAGVTRNGVFPSGAVSYTVGAGGANGTEVQHETQLPVRIAAPADSPTSRAAQRQDRMEAALLRVEAELAEQRHMLAAILDALVPVPIDWDAAWQLVDHDFLRMERD